MVNMVKMVAMISGSESGYLKACTSNNGVPTSISANRVGQELTFDWESGKATKGTKNTWKGELYSSPVLDPSLL